MRITARMIGNEAYYHLSPRDAILMVVLTLQMGCVSPRIIERTNVDASESVQCRNQLDALKIAAAALRLRPEDYWRFQQVTVMKDANSGDWVVTFQRTIEDDQMTWDVFIKPKGKIVISYPH